MGSLILGQITTVQSKIPVKSMGYARGVGSWGGGGGGLGRGMSISGIDWYITPYVSGILVDGRIPSLY